MLLFVSSAGARRAVGGNVASIFASAFVSPPSYSSATSSRGAAAANPQSWPRRSFIIAPRFMSTTDAAADEKTEEEKAAVKAAREARK